MPEEDKELGHEARAQQATGQKDLEAHRAQGDGQKEGQVAKDGEEVETDEQVSTATSAPDEFVGHEQPDQHEQEERRRREGGAPRVVDDVCAEQAAGKELDGSGGLGAEGLEGGEQRPVVTGEERQHNESPKRAR